jgi:hypothetical protein
MKYVLLDFFETNELDIVESDWIKNVGPAELNEENFEKSRVVQIVYPACGTGRKRQHSKPYSARVIKCSGKLTDCSVHILSTNVNVYLFPKSFNGSGFISVTISNTYKYCT